MVNMLHIEVASLLLLGTFKLQANSPVLPNTVDNFTDICIVSFYMDKLIWPELWSAYPRRAIKSRGSYGNSALFP